MPASCCGEKRETVYAHDTFQYNDRPNLTEEFRSMVERKRANEAKEQFPVNPENAHQTAEQNTCLFTVRQLLPDACNWWIHINQMNMTI